MDRAIEEYVDNQVYEFMKTKSQEEMSQIYMNNIYPRGIQINELFHNKLYEALKKNDRKYYYYLVTFTLKPEITEDKYVDVESYIIEQSKRTALRIEEAYLVKEMHKSGKPHWHMALKLGKMLPKSRFNYYEKLYGHVDISKSSVNTIQESLNYISKDNKPTRLV